MSEKMKIKNMVLGDFGRPEYLDGATAQYYVEDDQGDFYAYFDNKEDALLFIKAKIADNRRKKKLTRSSE